MEFNLLKNSIITYNSSVGSLVFDQYTTTSLITPPYEASVLIHGGESVCFDIDLLNRVAVGSLHVYTTITGSYSDTVALYCKDYTTDAYTSVSGVVFVGGAYQLDLSNTDYKYPRYIRIHYSVISGSCNLTGIEVTNEQTSVGFGEDNLLESDSIIVTKGISYIREIPIYNNQNNSVLANVQIEPIGSYIDNYMYIGGTTEGPWISVIGKGNCVVSGSTFLLGTFEQDSVVENSLLTITNDSSSGAWASNVESAVYVTPIFFFDKTYSNFFIDMYNRDIGCSVSVDLLDSEETFEVKSCVVPIDYAVYRTVSWVTGAGFYMYDYDLRNGELVTSLNDGESVFYDYQRTLSNYTVAFNTLGYCASIIVSSGMVVLVLFDQEFEVLYTKTLADVSSNGVFVYQVLPDFGGGVWLYVYINIASTSFPLNQNGYFFMHYDRYGTLTFKATSSSKDIYSFSVVPNSTTVWYTSVNESSVISIDSTGELLYSFFDVTTPTTSDLRGCCATTEGGCWFINGDDLYKIDSNGSLINSVYGVGNTNTLSYIVVLDDDSVVVRDGSVIKRILTYGSEKGRVIFSVTIAYADRILYDTKTLWVYCTTGYMYGVDVESGIITNTIGQFSSDGSICMPGIFRKSFTSSMGSDWVTHFPIVTDAEWNLAQFSKVFTDSFLFSNQYYHKAMITLRANKPYNKYDVPITINTWDPNDDFDVDSGYVLPYAHRWVHTDLVSLDTISGTCLLDCGVIDPISDPHTYLYTKGRWYIKGEVNSADVGSAYDIQVDFTFPPVGTGDVAIYIAVVPNNNETDYIRAIVKRVSGVMTLRIEDHQESFYSGDVLGPVITISPAQTQGKIRLVKNGARTGYAYFYNIPTSTWLVSSIGLNKQSTYYETTDFDLEKNWFIKIGAYGAGIVTLDNFIVNTANVYWYLDAPHVKGLYLREYLTVPDIYPRSHKPIYLKVDIPYNSLDYTPKTEQTYNLRVWWENQI